MKRSKTEFRGAAALALATKHIELTVTTGVGPRVTSFRPLAGPARNLFLEFPADESRALGYLLRGGHRLWHSPEDAVRTYQPDDEPLVVKLLPRGVALTQPVEPKTGLQKGMKIELFGERTVKITHTLKNRTLWPIECAPWALTMLRPGGYGVVPLLPKGDHAKGDFLPTWTMVPWTFTDLSLPVWKFGRNFIGVEVAQAKNAQKIGLSNYPGWSACWLDGVTFVKYAPVVHGARYPDLGCAFETFTNGAVLELETLGALAPIAPGKTVTHTEWWTILEKLPRPDNDAAFDRKLAPAVNAWLAGLKAGKSKV
jgi:hypothetical protein